MPATTVKKLLLSLIVVGILGSFAARGTFAVLNGEGQNGNNALASGTLTLENTVGAGTPCDSQNGALNVNTGCDTFFTSPLMYPIPSAAEPPLPASSTYASAIVTIKNTGSLAATLKVYLSSAVASTTTGAPSFSWSAINPVCPGGSYPCTDGLKGSLDLFIQECSAVTSTTCTTPLSSCVWPVSTSAACTFVDDSFGDFNSFHHDNTHYLSLGAIAAGATRYFEIAVAEPSDAANGLQGQTATFALHWHEE